MLLQGSNLNMPLAELISSLTVALDMTEGQPPEHSMRCCWIGMHIGERMNLSSSELHDLYFTLLLKDAAAAAMQPVFVNSTPPMILHLNNVIKLSVLA